MALWDRCTKVALIALCFSLLSCLSVPPGITAIENFNAQRYLGNWYEIARLDHSFERGLKDVKAHYSWREDGGIKVVNSGMDTATGEQSHAHGKAYFVGARDVGHLKVSFFGPFYGSYVIFALDSEYQHAFVTSNTREYLWLLSRTPTPSQQLVEQFIERANALGFDTASLIWVAHSPSK